MLFNTLQFAIFFFIVYLLYLVLSHKWQNRMLLIASCIFYGAWNWKFLFLLFLTIGVDYFIGLKIHETEKIRKRKILLAASIFINLGILGVFKYYNFFAENLQALINLWGFSFHLRFLKVILPIGISFYTFQSMSYVIDIYRRNLKPAKNILDFALFVTYFPQLVAGPIERAIHLLPQVLSPRKLDLDKFYQGCYLIFWGLFQKVFVADNLAKIVDATFAGTPPYQGTNILLSIYAFAFQIFCDFAGYSNIARGLGKCMGFDIMINFNLPYFATNPREFWQRWHISLSTWLRDYLYIPLGGNRKGALVTCRNLFLTMFLGGLWHGAAWTYVIWGAYHGILLIIYKALGPFLKIVPIPENRFWKKAWFLARVAFFFHLTCLGWLIFRARSLKQLNDMLTSLLFNFRSVFGLGNIGIKLIFFVWILLVIQVYQFAKNDLSAVLRLNPVMRAFFYYICVLLIIVYGVQGGKQFIYFQF